MVIIKAGRQDNILFSSGGGRNIRNDFSPPQYTGGVYFGQADRPNLPEGTIINGPGISVIPEFKVITTKKSTVASLAAKVDQIMDVLPTLIALLQAMADQQENWD